MTSNRANNLIKTSNLPTFLFKNQNSPFSYKIHEKQYLFQESVENLIDGILIVTDQKELIYTNEIARRVLCKLNQNRTSVNLVPREIWHLCQSLIQSRSLFPNQRWLIESTIFANNLTTLNVKARWLMLESVDSPCILVTVEDQYQAIWNIAVEEAQDYGLTRREREVWLLHRGQYTYKQIASELCITPNTVKKHMKSIHAKQKETSGIDDEGNNLKSS